MTTRTPEELEEKLHYHFKNKELLITALTHSSYANESKTPTLYNERLEFLGDSVLSVVVANYLFHHSTRPEGELSRMRASLVSEDALFQFAQEIDLGSYLRLGRGGDLDGGLAFIPQVCGHTHQQTLAEADIGAVHKQHVVHVGQVCRELSALASAGKLMGKKDANDLIACGRCLGEEALKQLRAGLAGGGQLLAGGQLCIIFRGGLVKAVPEDGAVLQRDVEGDDCHTQLRGLCGQDI